MIKLGTIEEIDRKLEDLSQRVMSRGAREDENVSLAYWSIVDTLLDRRNRVSGHQKSD